MTVRCKWCGTTIADEVSGTGTLTLAMRCPKRDCRMPQTVTVDVDAWRTVGVL